jgi:hypothetical protein
MITKETFHPADPYNLTPEEQAFADSLPMEELRELAARDMEEMHRQIEFNAKVKTFQEGKRDQQIVNDEPTPNLKFAHGVESDEARKIRERWQELDQIDELENSPEGQAAEAAKQERKRNAEQQSGEQIAQAQAEERAAALAKQVDDLQYVNDQLTHQTGSQLDQKIRDSVAQEMAVQRSLELQRMWCDKHPEYLRSIENGNLIKDYVAARYDQFTYANLEEAYNAVHDKLTLRQVPETAPEAPRTSKRASSVSTVQSSQSMYDRKTEPTQEDLENMPMDKFLEIGQRTGWIKEDAAMHEGVVPRRAYDRSEPADGFLHRF